MRHRTAILVIGALVAAACSGSSDSATTSTAGPPPSVSAATVDTSAVVDSTDTTTVGDTSAATEPSSGPSGAYTARITRTSYGIPHIIADDWGGLGFGQGYAFAQDRACTLIDQVIKVRGERSKWFGPGTDDANLNSDFAYRQLGLHDDADTRFGDQPANVAEMVAGYTAGFNAELGDEGPHDWCAGEPWVQPITTTDLYAYLNDVLLFASSGNLIDQIATAQPPNAATAATTTTTATATTTVATGSSADAAATTFGLRTDLASNGWAIGSALSESGGGMLLANPHFPWEGEKRLWESQLTLTNGDLDVYGASLSGVPGVLIGFNKDIAWTHTVSAGHRMTLYSLNLVPGDPTSFVYGDATEQMTSKDVTIDVLRTNGQVEPQTRTMWSSHYGPMLQLPFGWTDTTAYTVRDANIDDSGVLAQFFGMAAATSMDAFIDVSRTLDAIPWVNTIATSADGRAWYADTATTPNLSPAAIASWQANVASGALAKTVLDNGAILLDGSDPANEWVDDPTAVRPGLLPFGQQPQLERDDYVFNANDSHWLANPAELLTGYSPMTGPEAVPQSPRTRENAMLLTDPAVRGADGMFSLAEMQAAIFSNRGSTSDLLLDDVVAACSASPSAIIDAQPYDLTPVCAVLAGWDGRFDLDSPGAPLWREFMNQIGSANRTNAGDLFAVPFDAADPVGTPHSLAQSHDALLTKLATAASALVGSGFPIDSTLRDMQYDGRALDERIALPGGSGVDGTASVVDCCSGSKTLAPKGDPGSFAGNYFSEKGYPVTTGDSFIMTLEFTADGPQAEALLTYGQPDDLSDPNATAQTKLFAAGTFRPVLFTAEEIAADRNATTVTVTAAR